MSSLPIRLRLTLWYFAMFASASTLLCLTSLWMLQRSVDETVNHELQERADDVRVVLSHEGSDLTAEQLDHDFAEVYSLTDDGKYLQVRDEHGNWIFRSRRMIEENPDLPAPESLPKAGLITEFRLGIHRVRTLACPILVRGNRYSVQTGISLNKSLALLANFHTKLLLLTPIVILLAAVGGHAMSRKALRPVATLAAEVQRINDHNLDIRLPVSRTRDEIANLSHTLNQMLERIDKAFASVRAFTGNASHELRTPIALLRTEIEVTLYKPRTAEEYRAALDLLLEQTIRMTDLVENLLSLARADMGAETIAIAPIHLGSFLRGTRETWKSTMNQAMLDFSVEIPDDQILVLGDEVCIHRLFSILLENASKFTPPGGSVKIRTTVEESRVRFSVQDNGSGIAPEHKLRIFDRFFRATPNGGFPERGSGLGLALGKWIAERHGTELNVESEPGMGSSFSFCLESASQVCHSITSKLSTLYHDPRNTVEVP